MSHQSPPVETGAQLIAHSLKSLDVRIIFGIVGIPVIEVAEACLALGIKFVSFRNEQAASYAASAYGYLTGRPGVCLVVGGPGVLHAMAGVGNSMANATYPLLLLAGSAETSAGPTKGAFQQLDAVSLLAPHTKFAVRPPSLEGLPRAIWDAYRLAFYGRPGVGFVDLPADYIQGVPREVVRIQRVGEQPRVLGDERRVTAVAEALKGAERPLVVIGKGAAYARAEGVLREFIDAAKIPFLPTPQGKGVLPDDHPLNTSSARSAALTGADVVLLVGARLNWILHFGEPPKWSAGVRIAQIDISPEELDHGTADPTLSIHGDIASVIAQLKTHLSNYHHVSSSWSNTLSTSAAKNLAIARVKASTPTNPLTYHRTFALIKSTLESLSPGGAENLVYVSEGANTMDISRSIFTVSQPRQRLDAGTYATMGVGLGYAIAAEMAYNHTHEAIPSSPSVKKRIISLEGDSALGFSLPEIETMSRYRLPIIIFVMNNGGVYHGISDNTPTWGADWWDGDKEGKRRDVLLTSTALGFETGYDVVARGLGGRGWRVVDEEGLVGAVREAWDHRDGPSVVNVIAASGVGEKLEFGWLGKEKGGGSKL
ncbi:putative 2-hydroxyphytanoyl-CoA lyase [Tuber indicum]|nr:putative 2-hydroxyphytanoyl-CoA lyase [Tuber indicum]